MCIKDKLLSILRFLAGIVIVFIMIYVVDYPERKKNKEYREQLETNHKVIRAYINAENPRRNTIYYVFVVNGVEYSGVSRYPNLNPPYPREGDSIDVYYSAEDPNVNLWSGEFSE